MAIELTVRLNILAAQNELNLRIGDNIGTTGEEQRTNGAASPKPSSNIADAMPDASEPALPDPEESPPPRASSSLAGLRPPESSTRMASLRDLAASLQRREIADDAAVGEPPASSSASPNRARTSEAAGGAEADDAVEAADSDATAAEDAAGEARFRDAIAGAMRRAPAPASSSGAADGLSRNAAASGEALAEAGTAPANGAALGDDGAVAGDAAPDVDGPAPSAASSDGIASPGPERDPDGPSPSGPAVRDGPVRSAMASDTSSLSLRVATVDPAAEPGTSSIGDVALPALADHGAASAVATGSDTAALAEKLFAAALMQVDGQAQPERAGVIASFILNAAMIPGWPPPRPIEGPPLQVLAGLVTMSKDLTEADKELLLFLANMGFSRMHLKRLLRKLEAAKNKSKLLLGLTMFATNVASAAKALAEELADLLEDEDEERPALARTATGRARLDLR